MNVKCDGAFVKDGDGVEHNSRATKSRCMAQRLVLTDLFTNSLRGRECV